jgi:phosphoribosylformylglycinamidine synthase
MSGSSFPIAVSYGDGTAFFGSPTGLKALDQDGLDSIKCVENKHRITEAERYPYSPNGGLGGIASVRSRDGRVLALIFRPERIVRAM